MVMIECNIVIYLNMRMVLWKAYCYNLIWVLILLPFLCTHYILVQEQH